MQDAMKFLAPLLESSPQSIDVQLAGFEVFIRKSKSSCHQLFIKANIWLQTGIFLHFDAF
jgi:hypothetical protein